MASHFIPRFEWNIYQFTGNTTITSDTVTGITDTSGTKVGMFFRNSNFADGTTVVSFTATTITVSNEAIATASGEVFDLGEFMDMEIPPTRDPFGESLRTVGKTTTSKAGLSQTIVDYIQKNRQVRFSHMTQSKKEEFEIFLVTWAFLGKSFVYYTDKDNLLVSYNVDVEPKAKRGRFAIITRVDGDNFKWSFNLNMREIL